MNVRLKIKTLLILFCLFISANAVVNYKLLAFKNLADKSGFKYQTELSFTSLFLGQETDIPCITDHHGEAHGHTIWVNKIRCVSKFTLPVQSIAFSKKMPGAEFPQKIKKRKPKGVQNTCLLIDPVFIPVNALVHYSRMEYVLFYRQYMLSQEHCILALRGPPAVAVA